MVKYTNAAPAPDLDATFSALGDPTRRAILTRLMDGPARISDLAAPHDMSMPAISKHLDVLEIAGLLIRTRAGREIHCALAPVPLKAAADWVGAYRRFWEDRIEALGDYLDETNTDTPEPNETTPGNRGPEKMEDDA